jgi:putative flavoprotein involved in K+ transport
MRVSYYLTQANHSHIVLERDLIGSSWISKRWDSFTLVTPNWMNRLPGFPHGGSNPDGFLAREEIVKYLEGYAASFNAPIAQGINVARLSKTDDGYRVQTTAGDIHARNVVVCIGYFHEPKLPACASYVDSSIAQVHSCHYRNPDQLPSGGVLVVGSGQSGAQIAEELHEEGRRTVLAVSSAPREPRTYRGKDTNYWFNLMGGFDRPPANPSDPKERYSPNPHCSGKDGGHALNLEKFAEEGIRLVGRVNRAQGTRIEFAPDMIENVRRAAEASIKYMRAIDRLIEERGIDAPEPSLENTDDGTPQRKPELVEIPFLDLKAEGIASIVWATGFRCNFDWIDLSVVDPRGYPLQYRGITPVTGLYFCGLHWMHCLKSRLFFGVGEAAQHVTNHLLSRDRDTPSEAAGRKNRRIPAPRSH